MKLLCCALQGVKYGQMIHRMVMAKAGNTSHQAGWRTCNPCDEKKSNTVSKSAMSSASSVGSAPITCKLQAGIREGAAQVWY